MPQFLSFPVDAGSVVFDNGQFVRQCGRSFAAYVKMQLAGSASEGRRSCVFCAGQKSSFFNLWLAKRWGAGLVAPSNPSHTLSAFYLLTWGSICPRELVRVNQREPGRVLSGGFGGFSCCVFFCIFSLLLCVTDGLIWGIIGEK